MALAVLVAPVTGRIQAARQNDVVLGRVEQLLVDGLTDLPAPARAEQGQPQVNLVDGSSAKWLSFRRRLIMRAFSVDSALI